MDTAIIHREDKPSNTEVLGLLLNKEKKEFITNLNSLNLKAYCKLIYLTERLLKPTESAVQIHKNIMEEYLVLKCSLHGKRSDQIVDGIKHILQDQENQNTSMLDAIKK